MPSFDRVRLDLQEIKRLYEEQATHGLTAVATSSHRSVVKLIAVLGCVLLFIGISVWAIERIRTQAALHTASMQMEFVASVSHDLRTPLAGILSACQNITDGFAPNLPHYASMITTQTLQLIDLVDQILLFASMKDRRQQYSLRPLQVAELFENVRTNIIWVLQQEGFTVDFHVQGALPVVLGDLKALSRCLQNLIVNGVNYGGKSRVISVYAQFAETRECSKEVRISVEDKGLGIRRSELKQIFDPFYRSPRARAAQIRGTGLGLAVERTWSSVRPSTASK